jgi:phosphatidylserine decarboxylase
MNPLFLIGIILLILVSIFFLFYEFIFLRDPERNIPSGENVVSPCDGKVISITPFHGQRIGKVKKGTFGRIYAPLKLVGKEGTVVSIFMSPLDVHVTRAPIAGKAVSVHHREGKFLRAFDERALIENEKAEILIKGKRTVLLILIAGMVARRITTFLTSGDAVKKGGRIGIITLGSQCTLVLPKTTKIIVKSGDRVRAGESIIAR